MKVTVHRPAPTVTLEVTVEELATIRAALAPPSHWAGTDAEWEQRRALHRMVKIAHINALAIPASVEMPQ